LYRLGLPPWGGVHKQEKKRREGTEVRTNRKVDTDISGRKNPRTQGIFLSPFGKQCEKTENTKGVKEIDQNQKKLQFVKKQVVGGPFPKSSHVVGAKRKRAIASVSELGPGGGGGVMGTRGEDHPR